MKSLKIKVSVVTPFIIPLELDQEAWRESTEAIDSAVEEVMVVKAEDLLPAEFEPRNFKISPLKNLRKRKHRSNVVAGQRFLRRPCIEMEWSIGLTVPDFKIVSTDGSEAPEAVRRELSLQGTCEEFSDAITLLLIASGIAKPGVLRSYDHDIWIGNQFVDSRPGLTGMFDEIVSAGSKNIWPNVENLMILDVWNWLKGIGQTSVEFSLTPLGRAINAFTHLLTGHYLEGGLLIELMWAMVGLEALYGRGTSDITFQLVEKSKSFLGAPVGFEKLVKKMYSCRSGFVHGSLPFSGAFLPRNWDQNEKYDDESYRSTCLASRMLLATLQQLAKRKWKTLNFSFRADDPST